MKENFNYIWLFFSFLVLDQIVLHLLADVKVFNAQRWNWLGKAAECILAILFICTTLLTKKEAGFTLKVQHLKKVIFLIAAILVVTAAVQYLNFSPKSNISTETFVFQLLMPGIAEELVFRGVLLGLLNKVYKKSFTLWQTPMGWSVIITSLLFALLHAFNLENHTVNFNLMYFLNTFIMGLLFAFIKEKSQSLLPGIVCHNLFNLIVTYV